MKKQILKYEISIKYKKFPSKYIKKFSTFLYTYLNDY